MSSESLEIARDLEHGKVAKVMRGMKIRDEFLCPITYELMREPVVASDGHTYEKHAIEKWLKTNHTSPRSGEPMDSLTIANMNLKKLIQDIINEGGAGFYTSDISNQDRIFEVCPEKVLILECLGPPESEWNQQSFQVTKFGCVGGRKHNPEDSANLREIVLFKDVTVSRRHFEITYEHQSSRKGGGFAIRDLGSAGGTFIRIKYGAKKQLHPGMIILLGKHQFTVSSIDDMGGSSTGAGGTDLTPLSTADPRNALLNSRKSVINSDKLMSLVETAESLIKDFEREDGHAGGRGTGGRKEEFSARLRNLTEELSHLSVAEDANSTSLDMDVKEVKGAYQGSRGTDFSQTLSQHANFPHLAADQKDAKEESDFDAKELKDQETSGFNNYFMRRCTLTCCAPDGSPLQGKSFQIGPEGAMMGRKHTNAIALYVKVTDSVTREEKFANVDTAISSEHARVEFDEASGDFFISDGTSSKPSTNGTWFRLSGPHQESPPHYLQGGAEILIGTVRFVVKESMTISERKVNDEK